MIRLGTAWAGVIAAALVIRANPAARMDRLLRNPGTVKHELVLLTPLAMTWLLRSGPTAVAELGAHLQAGCAGLKAEIWLVWPQ